MKHSFKSVTKLSFIYSKIVENIATICVVGEASVAFTFRGNTVFTLLANIAFVITFNSYVRFCNKESSTFHVSSMNQ